MVNFIPDPDLQQILPPLLAHIPAAFSSPKAPPSLPPLLAPILRSRVEHLSFGNTPWLQLLTWGSKDDGERLYQHLLEQDYFFLHERQPAGRYSAKGFRRLDKDTIHLAVDVDELGLRLKFVFVVNDDNGEDDGWKLMDVRLLEEVEEEEVGSMEEWCKSVAGAEEAFMSDNAGEEDRSSRIRNLNMALGGGSGNFVLAGNSQPSSPTFQRTEPAAAAAQEEDDDDYWAQYDDIDGDSSRGDESTSHHSSSPVTSSAVPAAPAQNEEDYYSRYADVQPSLDNDDPPLTASEPEPAPESAATPMPSFKNHNRTDSSHTDASTRSTSSSPARSSLSTPLTVQTSHNNNNNNQNTNLIEKLERQAELNVQGETAIKQHVATSMKSLYRLWRAAGLEREEFEGMIAREVEMLAMMEEDDGSFGSS